MAKAASNFAALHEFLVTIVKYELEDQALQSFAHVGDSPPDDNLDTNWPCLDSDGTRTKDNMYMGCLPI